MGSGLSARASLTASGLSRRTIPAHPMGIVQQRPRGDWGEPWDHADWYYVEWWRIRLARARYFAGFAWRNE